MPRVLRADVPSRNDRDRAGADGLLGDGITSERHLAPTSDRERVSFRVHPAGGRRWRDVVRAPRVPPPPTGCSRMCCASGPHDWPPEPWVCDPEPYGFTSTTIWPRCRPELAMARHSRSTTTRKGGNL